MDTDQDPTDKKDAGHKKSIAGIIFKSAINTWFKKSLY